MTSSPAPPSARSEWQDGKMLVLTASFGVGLSAIPVYTLGIFVEPLNREFGWTPSQIIFAQAMLSLVAALGAPFAGILLDRFGSRPMAIGGAILVSACVAAIGLLPDNLLLYYALWSLLAIGVALSSAVIWMKSVMSHFHKSRGLAVALSLCGSNFAGAITPLIAVALLTSHGWRVAYFGLGAYMIVSVLPLALIYLRDKMPVQSVAGQPPAPALPGFVRSEVLRQRVFWVLAASFLLAGAGITAFLVNLVPMLASRGMSQALAASAVSSMAIAAIIGRITSGSLIDRLFAPHIAVVALLMPVLASLILLFAPPTYVLALVAAALVGLSTGAEFCMLSYLTSRFFGMKAYGSVSGLMIGAFTIGSVIGPALMAKSYEWTGGYETALYTLIATYFIAAGLMLFTGPYPDFETVPASDPAPAKL